MSIPESAWPEGALLHSVYTFDGQSKGRWHFLIDTDALPGVSNWCECGSKTAPAFDLAPGTITGRYSAELESLRDENQRLRGIVPEVLEQINDALCEENEQLHAKLSSFDSILAEVEMSYLVRDHTREDLRAALLRLREERDAAVEKCVDQQSCVERLQGQSEDDRKITGILLAHLGLDESAAFTEAGVPNPGRLRSVLAYENKS